MVSRKQHFDEILKVHVAKTFKEEIEWVSQSIVNDIKENNLLLHDILIICLDDSNARTYFREFSKELSRYQIYTNNVLESYNGDNFIVEGRVTLSTVYRAKGNEAAMVYVVGADAIGTNQKDDIISRNKLFTAFTRAKAWLRITGCNENFNYLL